jgi:hypothetical protein
MGWKGWSVLTTFDFDFSSFEDLDGLEGLERLDDFRL